MTWFNKVFNVRREEWKRLLLLAFILSVSNIGTNWGANVAYAEFLKQSGLQAGLQTLTWVIFLSAVLSVPALGVYAAFVDRIDNNRLFASIVAAGGMVLLAGTILWRLGFIEAAFPFIYVLSQVWLAIFNLHFFTYVNELFDIQSAKRTLPIILATGRIGAAAAGFTLKPLVGVFDSLQIIWIWLAADALVIAAILALPFFIKKDRFSATSLRPRSHAPQDGAASYFASLKEGWTYTVQSAFLRWMAAGTLLLAVLVTLFEYYGNKIMTPMFASSADYAGFLGQLDGISNLAALLILLFGLSRMTKAWGVGNTSLAFPSVAALVGGGMAIFPTILFPAAMSYLTRKGLRFSLQLPLESLLYNAVPVRVKGRVRAFVSGLLTPLGALIGVGFLLLELQYGGRALWLGGAFIALFALAYLLAAWMIRYYYAQALVKMLEEEDYSFLLTEGASELTAADPAALRRLQQKLEQSGSHEMRVFITQLIAQAGGSEALPILIPIIRAEKDARTRAAMLSVVTAAGARSAALNELCADFLSDPDPQVRQAAASGLEQALGSQAQEVRQLWLSMVDDPDLQVSAYALKSLAATGGFYEYDHAVEKLEKLCASESVAERKNAIGALGVIADARAASRLLAFLRDPDSQVRLEAMLNLERMPLPLDDPLDEEILQTVAALLKDPVARVRQAALIVAGKYRRQEIYPLLVSALADKSSQVRAAAVDLLVAFGKEAIRLAQAGLNSPEPQTYKMSAVVLTRIHPRQFTPLIDKIVSDDLNRIYQFVSFEEALSRYDRHRSVRALISLLRENNHALIDEILYLLSAIHDPSILKVVGESLHSDSPATRNLALEALESITSPQTAALIASIFEPNVAPLQLLQLGQGSNLSVERLDALQALERLSAQREDTVRYLLTLHVAGDVGAELAAAGAQNDVRRIQAILENALHDDEPLVRESAADALEKLSRDPQTPKPVKPLSLAEKMIILKEVSFFRNIPAAQLQAIAEASAERKYAPGERVFKTDDPGGALYIVVDGRVHVEQEKRAGTVRLATLENDAYFGEMSLFGDNPRSASVIAERDSILLEVSRAPIMALTMQNPDMALELITLLSQRIRETSEKLAETVRSRPRQLHNLYDQFR